MKKLLLLSLFSTSSIAGQFDLILNGQSFHSEKQYIEYTETIHNKTCYYWYCSETTEQIIHKRDFNQTNTGLGIQYDLNDYSFIQVGYYKDSYYTTANYIGIGYTKNFNVVNDLKLGTGITIQYLHSPSYMKGHPFIVPLPIATFGTSDIALQMLFSPKIGKINDVDALFFQLKIKIK